MVFGFEGYSESQYELLIRKGVYPCEHMSCWDKFTETELPYKEAFYSNLYMSNVSNEDYQHAQHVWSTFSINNLGEYHNLYLCTNVILLGNVFEAFRDTCLEHYSLDSAHFYTSPGLAWKACLKKTGVKLELLTDPNMLLMSERGIRGSVTQVVHRYVKVNNVYMGDWYNPREESSFRQYLEANNLYGWAMSQLLPAGGFRWVNIEPNEIDELARRTDKGYLLEVYVSYPAELYHSHKDLPFMCERMKINCVKKLVPNLYNKRNYVIHIRVLDQAFKHGLIPEKIYCTIEFDQSAWMKPYIDFNTQLRTQARNNFEKDFFKLMNNAVFGKTMESIRNHRNIKLVMSGESYLCTVIYPNFKSGILFGENLMGCEMGTIKVLMNKPVYLGQLILDLSKIIMYEFHYDYMKPRFKDLCLQGAPSIGAKGLPHLQLNLLYGHQFTDISNWN